MADASCQSDADDDIIYLGTERSSVSKTLPSARLLIKQEPGTFAENGATNMSTADIDATARGSRDAQSPSTDTRTDEQTIDMRGECNYSETVAMEGYIQCVATSTTSEEDLSPFVIENVVSLKTEFQAIEEHITTQESMSGDKKESEPRHVDQSLSFSRRSATSQSRTVLVPLPVHEFQDCLSGAEQAKSLRQLSSEGYYRCSGFDCRCIFRTLNPNELEKHLTQDHPSDNTYTCVHCGSAEIGLGNFLHHLEQHLSPQSHSLYCSDVNCNFSASSPESVINHMGTCHPAHINHVCWLCNDKFNSLQEFAYHVKRNLLIIASCPRCSAKDVHEKEILSHVEFSHPDHGRRVDFHKILLCQDRKMNSWHQQNASASNGDSIQPSAFMLEQAVPAEHISLENVSHSLRQVNIPVDTTVGQSDLPTATGTQQTQAEEEIHLCMKTGGTVKCEAQETRSQTVYCADMPLVEEETACVQQGGEASRDNDLPTAIGTQQPPAEEEIQAYRQSGNFVKYETQDTIPQAVYSADWPEVEEETAGVHQGKATSSDWQISHAVNSSHPGGAKSDNHQHEKLATQSFPHVFSSISSVQNGTINSCNQEAIAADVRQNFLEPNSIEQDSRTMTEKPQIVLDNAMLQDSPSDAERIYSFLGIDTNQDHRTTAADSNMDIQGSNLGRAASGYFQHHTTLGQHAKATANSLEQDRACASNQSRDKGCVSIGEFVNSIMESFSPEEMTGSLKNDQASPSRVNHSDESGKEYLEKRDEISTAVDTNAAGHMIAEESTTAWVRETFNQQTSNKNRDALDISCSRCDTGSQTLEDHIKHIYASHRHDFRGFACHKCPFVSADPEHIHTCRRLRSPPAATSNPSTSQADMPGSSNSDMPHHGQVTKNQSKSRKRNRSKGASMANSQDRNGVQLPQNDRISAPGPSTSSSNIPRTDKKPWHYCKLCHHTLRCQQRMRAHIYKKHKEKMKCPKCDDYVPSNDTSFKVHFSEVHKDVNEALYRQHYSLHWITSEITDKTMLGPSPQVRHQRAKKPKRPKKHYKGATYKKWS
ncbi:serine-rich adhesin for platelets-like [Littorina saxatilis]|uniref:serine-rich adhesin for platelets-like n=1 Tax=Littorina saxatilis TaxID=31220 RepID=UPI0038B5A9F5